MEWFKSLLGRRDKASAARSLFAIDQPGRAVWSARRYDQFADEGYRRNVIAFSAINTVAEAAARTENPAEASLSSARYVAGSGATPPGRVRPPSPAKEVSRTKATLRERRPWRGCAGQSPARDI